MVGASDLHKASVLLSGLHTSNKFAIIFFRFQESFVSKRKFLSYGISRKENFAAEKKDRYYLMT